VLLAGAATTASWLGYGAAFWCLARGTLGDTPLGLAPAGGVGVREAVFIALLAPSVGSGGAIVLGVASRVLLTFTEVAAALLGVLVGRTRVPAGTGPPVPDAD
jgi:hypothetical protein